MTRLVLTGVALAATLTLTGCTQVPTPAQRQSFSALNQAWPSVQRLADRGAEDMLEDGDVNEAGKAVLDARTAAFGQLIADLQSGGE